jgi:hypothetical protein
VEVVDVSNYNLVEMMGGKHGCTFPHPTAKSRVDSVPATNAIIDWRIGRAGNDFVPGTIAQRRNVPKINAKPI